MQTKNKGRKLLNESDLVPTDRNNEPNLTKNDALNAMRMLLALTDNIKVYINNILNNKQSAISNKDVQETIQYINDSIHNIISHTTKTTENKQYNTNSMKGRIRLTEGYLRRLVESALNELDWKTYMNAAKGRDIQGRYADAYDLRSHAGHMFDKKYGVSNTVLSDDDYFGFDADFDDDGKRHLYHSETGGGYWEGDDYTPDEFPPVNNDAYSDVECYSNGDSKYIKGKGWSNESRRRMVNAITESVIRRLRRR